MTKTVSDLVQGFLNQCTKEEQKLIIDARVDTSLYSAGFESKNEDGCYPMSFEDASKMLTEWEGKHRNQEAFAKQTVNETKAMLLKLKELHDLGSPRAMEWYDIVAKRLKTKLGKEFAEKIIKTPTDEWWTIDRKAEK